MILSSQKKRSVATRALSYAALTGLTILIGNALAAPAQADSYTVTELYMLGNGINDSDVVVGQGPIVPAGSPTMWTWDPVNGAVNRGAAASSSSPIPFAIGEAITNGSSPRIVGHAYGPGPDCFNTTYWDLNAATPPAFIPTLLLPYFTTAQDSSHMYGIDSSHGIAGSVKAGPVYLFNPAKACWWWVTPTNPNPLSPINLHNPAHYESWAYDINDYGTGSHNVVGAGRPSLLSSQQRAFIQTVQYVPPTAPVISTQVELFPSDTTQTSEARAINSSGTVVGTRDGHAFVFVPSTPNGTTGTITFLSETPSGGSAGTGSRARAINSNGTIVGYYLTSTGTKRAARWDAPYTGNVVDLNSMASLGSNNEAAAINSQGNIVAVVNGGAVTSQLLTHHP